MGAVAYALPFFALTLFVSAFLLFLVQPIIGKMILPKLGGTPQVWNTCMVFFQAALLAGYTYTHFVSTRLKLRAQLMVHGIVLLTPLILLYLFSWVWYGNVAYFYSFIQTYKPITGANPIFSALVVLLCVVGLPFIVVATSAPLLQKWFIYTGHPAAKDPYFLYGASNLGSFLSLIAYPFFLERMLGLSQQSWIWTIGYTVLVVLIYGCTIMIVSSPPQVTLPREKEIKEPARETAAAAVAVAEKKEEVGVKAGAPPGEKATAFKKGAKQFRRAQKEARARLRDRRPESGTPAPPVSIVRHDRDPRLAPVTPLRRLRWIALAAIPSSLMLGVTSYATTDLSPIPLLWLIPLMLYLLSFILVFSRWPVVWVEKPHDLMVKIQPFTIAALILALVVGHSPQYMVWIISIHMIAFFVTTMVCHGELAKDRPATEHLTEFYLLMSVGGVVGGSFNALIAPVVFVYVLEYGLAIFFSGLMRPRMAEVSWMDQFFEGLFGAKAGRGRDRTTGAADYPLILDIALPIVAFIILALLTFLLGGAMRSLFQSVLSIGTASGAQVPFLLFVFGLGLIASILFMERPLRYGLMIGGLLLIQALSVAGGDNIWSDRSYFGVIRVRAGYAVAKDTDFGVPNLKYTNMIHGTTDHGMNFRLVSQEDRFNPNKDFSRLATTYYHRLGPAGRVMELFNWFPGEYNTFTADVRMPVTIIGMNAMIPGFNTVPADTLVALWSEPPYATIGLGTGTMASYARPFQHMHYYEIDRSVLRLSIPTKRGPFYDNQNSDPDHPGYGNPLFTYLRDAKGRGAEIWVLMGDARLRMAQPYSFYDLALSDNPKDREALDKAVAHYHDNVYNIFVVDGDIGGGPEHFYHMMVVDAFSSDAIPVHLITREAIQMYFEKLTEDGILCVHTSNKFVNLVPVVKSVADSLEYVQKDVKTGKDVSTPYPSFRAHDNAIDRESPKTVDQFGHYTSEWVMVAKKLEYLDKHVTLGGKEAGGKKYHVLDPPYPPSMNRGETYWMSAPSRNWAPWTDDYSNVVIAIRWPGSGNE